MESTAIAISLPRVSSRSSSMARLADFVSLMKPRVMSDAALKLDSRAEIVVRSGMMISNG